MTHPVHARIDGPIVMIGFGSIGKGTLPLLVRHIAFDRSKMVIIDPSDRAKMMMATGFGLAVMAPAIGINYLYQRRSLKLFLIDAGHFVVGMAVVGLVFVLLG